MNKQGFATQLHDTGGPVMGSTDAGYTFTAMVTATLAGNVTVTGIANSDGSATSWILPAGTTAGIYAAPGSGKNGGAAVWYSLASAADADKVTISCVK